MLDIVYQALANGFLGTAQIFVGKSHLCQRIFRYRLDFLLTHPWFPFASVASPDELRREDDKYVGERACQREVFWAEGCFVLGALPPPLSEIGRSCSHQHLSLIHI